MRDYEELVKALREADSLSMCGECGYKGDKKGPLFAKAADAIEELQKRVELEYQSGFADGQRAANRKKNKWIKIESRPMTEEERKEWSERIGYDIEYEDAIIYTSKLPDDGQEVLVCNKWGHVWIDTFSDGPDYVIGFEENGDMDGIVAWMPKPLPEPPKEEKECI